ncbi:MAG TPA: hypothetical protein VM659_14590, partial [Dongiaceae bacterium]|nr:hypothetical protein [Dongiaceae bacterium]
YFGQTVNIAARLQSLAQSRTILTTDAVVGDVDVRSLLGEKALKPSAGRAALRGIQEEMAVYEIA